MSGVLIYKQVSAARTRVQVAWIGAIDRCLLRGPGFRASIGAVQPGAAMVKKRWVGLPHQTTLSEGLPGVILMTPYFEY